MSLWRARFPCKPSYEEPSGLVTQERERKASGSGPMGLRMCCLVLFDLKFSSAAQNWHVWSLVLNHGMQVGKQWCFFSPSASSVAYCFNLCSTLNKLYGMPLWLILPNFGSTQCDPKQLKLTSLTRKHIASIKINDQILMAKQIIQDNV